MTPWIQTASGKRFPLTTRIKLIKEQIDLYDIAHSLAATNRFNGATFIPISVAVHSMAVAKLCPNNKKEALLHDAAEAYLGDISTPVKNFLGNSYHELEEAIDTAIREYFNISSYLTKEVAKADLQCLLYEKKHFMLHDLDWELPDVECPSIKVLGNFYYQRNTSTVKHDFIKEVESCL